MNPMMIEAGMQLGVDNAKTVMAIAGLKVKDIMGFCVIILFYSLIPISIVLLLLN